MFRMRISLVVPITLAISIMLLVFFYSAFAQLDDKSCSEPSQPSDNTWKIVQERKCFRVGLIEYPPFSFISLDFTGGFAVDLAKEIAVRLSVNPDAVEFIDISDQQNSKSRLDSHDVDLVIVPPWLTQESQRVDFSEVYFQDELVAVTLQRSNVYTLADLDGKPIGVVEEGIFINHVKQLLLNAGIQTNPVEPYDIKITGIKQGLNNLNSEYDAIIGSSSILRSFVQENNSLQEFTLEQIEYQMAVRQQDAEWLQQINCALADISQDGVWAELHNKWFENKTPLTITSKPQCEQNPVTPEPTPTPTVTSVLTETPILTTSTIQRIRERGYLIVGVLADFEPMGYVENNQLVGFDIDIVKEFAKHWLGNDKICTPTDKNECTLYPVPLTVNARIPTLVNGDVDLIAGAMTHTWDREARIDFSQNYFLDGQGLLVLADSPIQGLSDLITETKVAAIRGSTSIEEINAYAANKGFNITIKEFPDHERALEALKEGQVDVLTSDRVHLVEKAKKEPTLLRIAGDSFTSEPYGFGVQAGDSNFRHLVDYTLQQIKVSGRYDEIYTKWFTDSIPYPSVPYPVEIISGTWPYTFATSPTELQIPTRSVIQKMQSEKKLVVGVMEDFAPFSSLDNGNCCVGFDVDIVKEFARRWLGNDKVCTPTDDSECILELVPLTVKARSPLLEAGKVDLLAAAMTQTWEREKTIDFSQTYFLDGQSLLVHKDSGINGLQDLQGKHVASLLGSTSIVRIEEYANRHGIQIEIEPFPDNERAVEALRNGLVDAFTTDKAALLPYTLKYSDTLAVVGEPFTNEPYGIGIPANDHQFRDLVNATLQEMRLDGAYERLYQQWFGNAPITRVEIWPRKSYTGHLDFSLAPMVYITPGLFIRGSITGEIDEQPTKTIFLDGFYIDQYEVTNRLYRECVAAGKCVDPPKVESSLEGHDYNDESHGNYPVIWVRWEQANQYCSFLGKRLPTEAEWEKAARSSQNHIYPWGNEEKQGIFAEYKDTTLGGSTADDESDYHVYDMAGNVREWVYDFYDRKYYEKEVNCEEIDCVEIEGEKIPRNPINRQRELERVVRGGSWYKGGNLSKLWRATSRQHYLSNEGCDSTKKDCEDDYTSDLGFRCAADKPPILLSVQN